MKKEASQFSIRNMEEIRKSKLVECYYCISIYKMEEIKETTDNGETALCPKCGIDSVLSDLAPYKLDKITLSELHKKWF